MRYYLQTRTGNKNHYLEVSKEWGSQLSIGECFNKYVLIHSEINVSGTWWEERKMVAMEFITEADKQIQGVYCVKGILWFAASIEDKPLEGLCRIIVLGNENE